MKVIKLAEPWKISCVDIEKPVPKPGEALIKVVAAGICGSDIGAFRGTNGLVSYPRVIGHELAGVVESIPENNKNGIKVGDRVVVDPYLYCGHCYPCSIGSTNCCTDLKVLGVHVDGGMSEYFTASGGSAGEDSGEDDLGGGRHGGAPDHHPSWNPPRRP